jgi:Fe2+ transport system protein FeoA
MSKIRLTDPLTLRLGTFAIVLRRGVFGAGWSKVWWRIWRYSERKERIWLEIHARIYGLGLLPGESIGTLRMRVDAHVREIGEGAGEARVA